MRRSLPRSAWILLVLASALPGCGDDGPKGPRVVVVLSSADRPGPSGYRLRSLVVPGTATYPLVPVRGAPPGVHEAKDAPDGPYGLEADGGWTMIWPRQQPPDLRRSAPQPEEIQLGRPHSLYVARESTDFRFTNEWVAFREGSGGRVPLTLTAEVDDLGVAVLRVPPDVWRGKLVVFGRIEGGNVTNPLPFELKEGGRPMLRAARPAQILPLRVHAFGNDGAPLGDAPGAGPQRVVHVELADLPFVTFDAALAGGTATFGAIPFLERPLLVSSDTFGGTFVLDVASWLASQEMRVTVPGPAERVLRVPGAPESLEVQARPAAGLSYGLVPLTRSGDALTLRLPPGDVRLLVRAGDRWAVTRTPEGAGEWTVPFADFQPAANVRIPLRGGSGGQVQLFRVEDGLEVLAQGLTRSARGGQEVVAQVPPGSYRLAWVSAKGTSRHPAVHTMQPGGQMRIPLD